MRKILVAIGSRANYSSLKSAMLAIKSHPDLEMVTVAYSTAVLERFGNVSNQILRDGINVDYRISTHLEGESPVTMALSSATALSGLTQILSIESPNFLLIVGDRYEVLPAAMAAAYMNIRIAHTMGGEITGTVDESIRHAVSKLAHLHFVATQKSKERLERMGENPENVYWVGCPRIDLALEVKNAEISNGLVEEGVGASIDTNEPFVLVSQHPVTTEYERARSQMEATLDGVKMAGFPAIVLWPNSDAGGGYMSSGIRAWRERNPSAHFRFVKNLPVERYMSLMSKAICLVGNSSSGIREGGFLGSHVLNIGTRQANRESSNNVKHLVSPKSTEIAEAVKHFSRLEKPLPDHLYGRGDSGVQIAQILANKPLPPVQKSFFGR